MVWLTSDWSRRPARRPFSAEPMSELRRPRLIRGSLDGHTTMTADKPEALWRSQDGLENARVLRTQYLGAFKAVAELDAAGHRILSRISQNRIDGIDPLVATALLRRAVTQFVGIRHLLEASAIETAKLPCRALFETALAVRYLVHGGKQKVELVTESHARQREARARYFHVAAERKGLYARQGMLDGRWGRSSMSRNERRALRDEIVAETDRLKSEFPTQWRAYGPLRCYNKKKWYHDFRAWYSFGFSVKKVNTIRQLTVRFGWQQQYELFYAALSGVTHPTGVGHDVTITNRGVEVHHPYIADAFDWLAFMATSLQLFILAWHTRAYVPTEWSYIAAVQKKVRVGTANLSHAIPTGWL